MSLQFVVGAAGSGKSRWINSHLIRESIDHPEKNYMILVPEQFTMETQKAIAGMHPNRGTFNIDVLSFVRLAHKVFLEVGLSDKVVLDDMGKCVLLEKAALEVKDKLPFFRKNLKRPGFIDELKSMLSELYQYKVTPEMLSKADKGETSSLLSAKLKDMVTVYEAFQSVLGDRAITAEELLPVMCEYIEESGVLKDMTVVLDGYTGFTPVQYQVIRKLLLCCDQVYVVLTADLTEAYREDCEAHSLFYLSRHTMDTMIRTANELSCQVEADICLTMTKEQKAGVLKHYPKSRIIENSLHRFSGKAELDFLQSHIMRYSREGFQGDFDPEAVSIKAFRSAGDEVRHIVESICELVMTKGYRYREIAVITGNPEVYNPLFLRELSELSMPFFIDQKNGLINNPLAEYIRSLFEIILKDFSYESVFRLLKSGLSGIARADRDYIENYVIAMGIRGHKRWSEDWQKERKSGIYTDFDRLNRIRLQICEALLPFYESMKKNDLTVRERIRLLVEFMMNAEINEKMEGFCERFKADGNLLDAKEYEQAYGLIMRLFDQIEELMGDDVMGLADFAACFDSGLSEIKVGTIPACTDRLLIGDMERSRLSDIRVLFFAGVNEGQVPKAATGGGIFTDYDREELKKAKIELAPTTREAGFMDRFYLYLAFTKSSEKIALSFAKNDGDGKSLRPASCLVELTSLFGALKVVDMTRPDAPHAKGSLAGYYRYLLAGFENLRDSMTDERFMMTYAWFYENKREMVLSLMNAFLDGYKEESLTAELAKKLYGRALSASVSRLEKQAGCAFSHFLQYGLKLSQREQFSFEASDMGNLFHGALERYFNRAKEEKLDITAMDESKRRELVNVCVEDAARALRSDILSDSKRNEWLLSKLVKITDRTAWALGEQLKEGGYETDGCEVSFLAENTNAFTIPLSGDVKMFLKGRIDRIDTKTEGDRLFVRIIDYKSGSKTFDLVSVYYGTQIQLVFYMEAAKENLKQRNQNMTVLPGGVLYYNIADPIVDRTPDMDDEGVLSAILKELRMNGIVTEQSLGEEEKEKYTKKRSGEKISMVSDIRFEALQTHVHDTVIRLGEDIMSGKIQVDPYRKGNNTACDWCAFKSICGFDKKRKGYSFRSFTARSKEEIWAEITGEEEEDGEQMDE